MVSITRVLLLAAVAVAAVSARKSGPVRFAWMPMTTHVEGLNRTVSGMVPIEPLSGKVTGLGCDICEEGVKLAFSLGCEGLAGALSALCGPFAEICEAAAEIACKACEAKCNEDCWAQKGCSDVKICSDPGKC